jgi:hypothetical protein
VVCALPGDRHALLRSLDASLDRIARSGLLVAEG